MPTLEGTWPEKRDWAGPPDGALVRCLASARGSTVRLSAFCPCLGADRLKPTPSSCGKEPGFIGVNWEEPMLLPPMTGLENHCTRKGTGGSNPSLSASAY